MNEQQQQDPAHIGGNDGKIHIANEELTGLLSAGLCDEHQHGWRQGGLKADIAEHVGDGHTI